MSGLLGYIRAGVAGGAGAAKEAYQLNQQFDLRKALMDAEYDKRLQFERTLGKEEADRIQAARQAERDAAKQVYDRVQPDQRGGYQTDEMKAAEEADLDKRRLDEFAKEGLLGTDLAKWTGAKMSGRSEAALANRKLEQKDAEIAIKDKIAQIREAYTQGVMNIKEAQLQLATLKAQAKEGSGGGAGSGKISDFQITRQDYIEANKDNPKLVKDGKLTRDGLQELKSLNLYDTITTEPGEFEGDPDKVKRTSKVPAGQRPAASGGAVDPKSFVQSIVKTGR